MGKVLVTGAAGFIGFHLVRRLLQAGMEVSGLDNLNDYYDVQLKLARLQQLTGSAGFTFHELGLEDTAAINELFAAGRFDVVVNLAAQAGVRYSLQNPRAYIDSNVVGFMNILEGCRHHKVRHLVFASSSSVYGANTRMPFSVQQNVDHPLSLYAASKKANELMAHTYAALYGLPVTGLRLFTVYGPWGRPDMAPFLFAGAITRGEPINVFNYGKMQRDFTYVDDVVEGIARIMERVPQPDSSWSGQDPDPGSSFAPYRIYNLGNHQPVELLRFIEVLEECLGMKGVKNLLPIQPGDVPATYADIDDLVRDVGFRPSTSIEDGVGKFVDWYRSYYNV